MLAVGEKAPSFSGFDQKGIEKSLEAYAGKKFVIFFYPEDDTPTCTKQACNLRDNYQLLKDNGFEVIGVSPDEVAKHAKYQEKYDLPFTLIADPEKKIIEAFGVWGEKNMYGKKYMGLLRTTFVIDESGTIIAVIKKPRVTEHAEQILKVSGK
jgi:peroxiredoxin Q/BCP